MKPPTLRSRVTVTTARRVERLELVERDLAADLEVRGEPGDELSAGTCRRRAPSAGRSRCRWRRPARTPRSTRRSPRRPRRRRRRVRRLDRRPRRPPARPRRRRSSSGWPPASSRPAVEGRGDCGCVLAATGCFRCHCDGSFVGVLRAELEHRRDRDGDGLRVVVRDVRLDELRRRQREDGDEHELGEERDGAGDGHVLRVEVAPRRGAHGFISSGSTSRLSDVTPADPRGGHRPRDDAVARVLVGADVELVLLLHARVLRGAPSRCPP